MQFQEWHFWGGHPVRNTKMQVSELHMPQKVWIILIGLWLVKTSYCYQQVELKFKEKFSNDIAVNYGPP